MNLYKFNFDLGGSANTAQYVTIPTDSKYSLGIGFTKNGQPVDISDATIMLEDDLYQYDPREIFNNRAVFAGQTGGTAGEAKTFTVKYHDNDKDLSFKGVTVKTNDAAVSEWAVTESMMKIVYTDEWPEISAYADPATIYFVADRPPAPRPIPTPTPPGDDEYAIMVFNASEDTPLFDLTSPEECLNNFDAMMNYQITKDGAKYALGLSLNSSSAAEISGQASKVDQTTLGIDFIGDAGLELYATMIKDDKVYDVIFSRQFETEDAAGEWLDNYYVTRFGSDYEQPNTSNPIPSDFFDTFEITEQTELPAGSYTLTPDYVYVTRGFAPMKVFLNLNTFPQWKVAMPG